MNNLMLQKLILTVIQMILPLFILKFGLNGLTLGFIGTLLSTIWPIIEFISPYLKSIWESKREEEKKCKEERPFIVLNIMDGLREEEYGNSIEYNIDDVSFPAYASVECRKLCRNNFSWIKYGNLPFIQLKNISERPALSIKAKLIWNDGQVEGFNIENLNPNSQATLLTTFSYKYYSRHFTQEELQLNTPKYVELYFLTKRKEKVFMKFKVNSGYEAPELIKKKLEGKWGFFRSDEYRIDNFVQSMKINKPDQK